ncbi:MAG: dTMP kinase [Deltaproteobacteria bacterium]|nr:MAG: dTMP kinase [Deltaproteobacteria bacterium]
MSFIVLEGLDGAGTTTQMHRLGDRLTQAGHRVVRSHEPTDGPIGRLIRQTLRMEPGAIPPSCLPWLFAADRADHLARKVEPALASGAVVITDRYLHSSLAYQSLELGLEQVFALNQAFLVPDLTIFFDVPVEVCLTRIDARGGVREIFEERSRLEQIATSYEAVLRRLEARGDPIERIDGTGTIEQVSARIDALVDPLLTP